VRAFSVVCALACSLALFPPRAGSSQDATPSRLHAVATGIDGASLGFVADSIVREDGATLYDSLIHLRGNVEIRTCCLFRNPNPPSRYLVMTADEADYDAETGRLEARGTVRVSFQVAH